MLRRSSRSGRALVVSVVALLILAITVLVVRRATDRRSSMDPVALACDLDEELLTRLWRGHDPVASEDVTMVPREPNYIGTFDLVSHSGPWDYLQRIPLVLYGPGHVAASGAPIEGTANIVDVYPTIGELVDVDLPARDGVSLDAALVDASEPPRLIVVVVWDGAGRATLERWPDRWPTLARLERDGTSYANATVGTSPSVTSAVHSSLGTGAWPRRHGVTGNEIWSNAGRLLETFEGASAEALDLSTFADEADRAYGNRSVVGLLGWTVWHVGMLGHGRAGPGGDADEVALIEYDGRVRIFGNDTDFSTLNDLAAASSIDEHIERVDRRDGRVDGRWLGHDISLSGEGTWLTYSNPAWAAYQEDLFEQMVARGGYGRDAVPDFLLVNFKMTDLAGHRWALDSPESAAALEAQDEALAEMIEYLDGAVGDYVVIVTADHGHSASPNTTGAWPIIQERLIADLDAHFDVTRPSSLVEGSSAFGLYLSERVMNDADVSSESVAEFLSAYTVRDNWGSGDLPEGYEGRGDERVFSVAYAKSQMPAILQCAFGKDAPPRGARA